MFLFIFYFLAEMAVFMALAAVYGSTHSINLADIDQFVKHGHHKDIVSGLFLFAIACKSGLFLLNGQYFNLKHVSSNRIVCITLTSVPISAMVLLIKIKPLLNATSLAPSILPSWIYVSIISYLLIYLLFIPILVHKVSLCILVCCLINGLRRILNLLCRNSCIYSRLKHCVA